MMRSGKRRNLNSVGKPSSAKGRCGVRAGSLEEDDTTVAPGAAGQLGAVSSSQHSESKERWGSERSRWGAATRRVGGVMGAGKWRYNTDSASMQSRLCSSAKCAVVASKNGSVFG
jgi:hypothetical protein